MHTIGYNKPKDFASINYQVDSLLLDGSNIEILEKHLEDDEDRFFNLPNFNTVHGGTYRDNNMEGVIKYGGVVDGKLLFYYYTALLDSGKSTFSDDITLYEIKKLFSELPENNLQIGGVKDCKITINDSDMNYIKLQKNVYTFKMCKVSENVSGDILEQFLKSIICYYGMDISDYIDDGVIIKLNKKTPNTFFSIINKVSYEIAKDSRIGDADVVIMPTIMKNYIKMQLENKNIKSCIEYIGSFMGIDYFVSDKVDSVYVYKKANAELGGIELLYSYKNCKLNEINYTFAHTDKTKELVRRIPISSELEIDENLELTLNYCTKSLYPFLSVVDGELPYFLGDFNIILDSASQDIENVLGITNKDYIVKLVIDAYIKELRNKLIALLEEKEVVDITFDDFIEKLSSSRGYVIVNAAIADKLKEKKYFISDLHITNGCSINLCGIYNNVDIYVDPHRKFDDCKAFCFDKGNIELSYNKKLLKYVTYGTDFKHIIYNLKFNVNINEAYSYNIINI